MLWWYESPTAGNREWLVTTGSPTLTVNFTPPNQTVMLDQRLSNNTQVGKLRKWEGTQFTPYPYINPGTQFDFPVSSNQTIQGDQAIYSNEKYYKWNSNTADELDVKNHHTFTVQANDFTYLSKFNPANPNATVKNNLEFSPANAGTIQFKDSWLIDYADPDFGNTLRNREMKDTGLDKLEFKSRPSPFYPDYITSYNGDVYKGVFLNQGADWQPPYYSVKAISPQDIPIQHSVDPPLTLNHRFYFQNWGGENVEYQYPNQLETGVVFTNENAVATANMKGTQLSNEQNAYANNSQRKLVRTDDGWLHSVYESMGRVWYETSTDNGTTWRLMNNGKPLDSGEGKLPSIDYSLFYDPVLGNFYQVVIVFQENSSHKLRLLYYHRNVGNPDYIKVDDKVVTLLGSSYASHNANAVISLDHGNTVTLVWQHTSDGLYARSGNVNTANGISLFGTTGHHLAGTTSNSVTPSIYAAKSGTAATHLSWAQIVSEEQIEIKYAKMSGSNIIGNIVTASQGSGFSKNYNPSIIEINGGARICWIGFRDISRDEYKTVFKDPDYWRFWNFDDGVKSVNINKAPNYYALAWGRGNNYPVRYTISSKLKDPQPLSIYGKDVQVCNGSSPTDVRAMAFNSNALPYYFTNSDQRKRFGCRQRQRRCCG